MMMQVSKLGNAVNFFAEMSGRALFFECKLVANNLQDDFVNGYVSIYCGTRIID